MEFTVSQLVHASPEVLFDVWLSADSPYGPWVGDGARRLDPSIGGPFYWLDRNWTDTGPGGGDWPHYGRFLRIESPRVIEFTWMAEFTRGLESIVTVTFREASEGTQVELRHRGLPDDQFGRDHEEAWQRILHFVSTHFPAGRGPDSHGSERPGD